MKSAKVSIPTRPKAILSSTANVKAGQLSKVIKEDGCKSHDTLQVRRKDMDKNVGGYFSSYANDYQDEFVASCDDDKTGSILKFIKKYSEILESKGRVNFAYDFGCGPGLYIKHFAHRFKKVEGCDIADDLIEKATNVFCSQFDNVNLFVHDLTRDVIPTKTQGSFSTMEERPTFAVCANVLIVPDLNAREKILKTIHRTLAEDSYIIFVLPSIESALYCNYRMKLLKPRNETIDEDLTIKDNTPQQAYKLVRGIIDRDGVPTKHYVKQEALYWLGKNGFEVLESSEACYDWETEYPGEEYVSSWVRNTEPLPFDHVFVCSRKEEILV